MKLYAKQVPPEGQESPLDFSEDCMEGIVLDGNDRLRSHTTPAFDHVVKHLEDMSEDWREQQTIWTYINGRPVKQLKESCDYTAADALRDYQFNKQLADKDGGDWTEAELAAWKELLMDNRIAEADAVLKAMSLITGHAWKRTTITGSSPSDWQTVYYDCELWGQDSLNTFETEYFNEGTEWIIHEGDAPESPDEIEGHSVYCVKYGEEAIKREIAAIEGVKPEDVVLFVFDGYERIAKYAVA